MRHLFEIVDNLESYWYSAQSLDEAMEQHRDRVENVYGEELGEISSASQVSDDKELTFENAFDDVAPKITQTALYWAQMKAGFAAASTW